MILNCDTAYPFSALCQLAENIFSTPRAKPFPHKSEHSAGRAIRNAAWATFPTGGSARGVKGCGNSQVAVVHVPPGRGLPRGEAIDPAQRNVRDWQSQGPDLFPVAERRMVAPRLFTAPGWLLASLILVPISSAAAEKVPDEQIAAHLAAGEFAPALAAVEKVADAAERDRLLGKIAMAQAASGGRQASLATLGDMSSDLARKAALERFPGPRGRFGGGIQADFEPLIELVTTTIAPTTWDEVGGPGSIDGFEGGVYVDSKGTLSKLDSEVDRSLSLIRRSALAVGPSGNPRKAAGLRKISLTRLEREIQLLHALGRQPDEAMRTLAGLQRIKYLLVYPETGDIVIAGPAGDWRTNAEGRLVSSDGDQPLVMLDDLVVLLRNAMGEEGRFGCSITPRREGLEAAQAVNDRWSKQPLKPGQRGKWLEEMRSAVGLQDITVYGIDPRTRAARVLVEADYHMKLVGMGLEDGVLGVESYLDTITAKPGEPLPPMDVLRWWFTLNYDSLKTTEARDGFELRGPGVKVLSENELLDERGERVHTGKSDELNSRFAQSFTKHFEALSTKYPVYADLRNIFDLALVAAVIRSHDLPGQTGWHLTHFGEDGDYQPELGIAPKQVDTIINHRILSGNRVVAGVSGGVTVDARSLAAPKAVQADDYGLLQTEHRASGPKQLPRGAWWWD